MFLLILIGVIAHQTLFNNFCHAKTDNGSSLLQQILKGNLNGTVTMDFAKPRETKHTDANAHDVKKTPEVKSMGIRSANDSTQEFVIRSDVVPAAEDPQATSDKPVLNQQLVSTRRTNILKPSKSFKSSTLYGSSQTDNAKNMPGTTVVSYGNLGTITTKKHLEAATTVPSVWKNLVGVDWILKKGVPLPNPDSESLKVLSEKVRHSDRSNFSQLLKLQILKRIKELSQNDSIDNDDEEHDPSVDASSEPSVRMIEIARPHKAGERWRGILDGFENAHSQQRPLFHVNPNFDKITELAEKPFEKTDQDLSKVILHVMIEGDRFEHLGSAHSKGKMVQLPDEETSLEHPRSLFAGNNYADNFFHSFDIQKAKVENSVMHIFQRLLKLYGLSMQALLSDTIPNANNQRGPLEYPFSSAQYTTGNGNYQSLVDSPMDGEPLSFASLPVDPLGMPFETPLFHTNRAPQLVVIRKKIVTEPIVKFITGENY